MSDDKSKTSQQDRLRVDINDPSEVEYLHSQFPSMTHEKIKDAIRAAGPMREAIISYLQKSM